jgi:hypothetical protein
MAMDLNFHVTIERYQEFVTWDMQIEIEEGKITSRLGRDLCAVFLVDENRQYIDPVNAKKILGVMSIKQAGDTAKKLLDEIRGLEETAVPLEPVTG